MEATAPDKLAPALEKVYPPRIMTRYLINPTMRALVGRRLVSDRILVLHFAGQRTGKQYALPVICHPLDDSLVVFTTRAWSSNFDIPRVVEVVRRGRSERACATRQRDPAVVADVYHRLLAGLLVKTAQRHFNIRIRGDRIPPLADLIDSCRSGGISLVILSNEPSGSRP